MIRTTGRLRRAALVLAAGALVACARRPPEVELALLGTTDVHGHLVPYDYATGEMTQNSLAQVATLVDSIRRVTPEVILLDSGDLLQGTPLDEYQARVALDSIHPVVAAMNLMGYDASAIGNHDFNYGLDYLARAFGGARAPFLAANIYVEGTDSLRFQPYRIVERARLRIGILGLTTPGVAVWDRANVKDRLRFEDMVESARRWVPRMREDGVDVVVVVTHSGIGPGSSYPEDAAPEENAVSRLAVEIPGIDVVFAGHTGVPIEGRRIGGTLVVQAGVHADHLAVAHLTVRRTAVGVEVSSRGEAIPTEGVTPSRRIVDLVADAHGRAVAWIDEPIGYTPDRWSTRTSRIEDTPIADLVTTVEREVTGADLTATAVFGTGTTFGPGPITRRDILALYRYPNTLRVVRVSGADLRAYLERSAAYYGTFPDGPAIDASIEGYNLDFIDGLDYALDLARPVGDRVVELARAGRAVADSDRFTLALNNYRQSGGGGFEMLADAPVVYADEVDIASRIIDFVLARDTLRAADVFRRNWELRPGAAMERLRAEPEAAGGDSRPRDRA